MPDDNARVEPISEERLISPIDDQIAALTFELEAERLRASEERARFESALLDLHRISAELAAVEALPWRKRRAG